MNNTAIYITQFITNIVIAVFLAALVQVFLDRCESMRVRTFNVILLSVVKTIFAITDTQMR